MSTMKAAVLESYGTALRLTDVLRPQPSRGEVLIRISASGVNPLDTKIFDGAAAHARHAPPAILGLDMAGTVEATGPGVARYREGDEVYGMIGGVGGASKVRWLNMRRSMPI
jgi:NADPH2:quinone reductase